MAKFSRFDSRNKKRGKHKSQSLERDLRRIRKQTSVKKIKFNAKLYNETYVTQEQEII